MPWLAAVAVAAGAVVGAISSSDARGDAKQAATDAWQELEKLGVPPDQAMPIVFERLKQQGLYDPKLEEAIQMGVSKVAQIKEDPSLRNAQGQALQGLQQRAAGGLSPIDRLAFNEARLKAAEESEAKRQQIIQNMQSRGMAGSGAELASQLSSAQAGDSDLSLQGDRIAATASQNALSALTSAGQLGGQIRGQDFDVNRTRAAAEDEMNRFNIHNQMAVNQRNVASQNDAQRMALAEKQRIADANAAMQNAELVRQKNAQQTNWQNAMDLAKTKANAKLGQASQGYADAAATAQGWQKIGEGAGGVVGKTYQTANAYDTPNQQSNYAAAASTPQEPSSVPNFTGMSDDLVKKYPNLFK